MTLRKKVTLLIVTLAALVLGCFLWPLVLFALFALQDSVGVLVNRPFSQCEIMPRARLEEALHNGFNINTGCCSEHMIGECSIARANSTPLVFAVEANNLEAAQLLLEHGADVNQSSESGYALAVAASQGNTDLAQLVLSHGPKKESRDVALRMAAHYGNTEIAKMILIQKTADADKPSGGELACSLVTELEQLNNPLLDKQKELFLFLIDSGLDPNTECETERLLSSIARNDEHAPIFKSLLDHGGDLDAREKNGKTVREFLSSFWDYNSRPKIKALIESH